MWRDGPGLLGQLARATERFEEAANAVGGVILRFATPTGPGTDYAPDGTDVTAITRGRFVLPQDARGYSSFVHVRDAVNALPKTRAAHRSLQLKLVGAAVQVELDGNGRISIPASHRSAVGIDRKAVLLGMGDKFELWSEQAHHAQIQRTLSDEDLSEEMLDLRL